MANITKIRAVALHVVNKCKEDDPPYTKDVCDLMQEILNAINEYEQRDKKYQSICKQAIRTISRQQDDIRKYKGALEQLGDIHSSDLGAGVFIVRHIVKSALNQE